MQSNSLSILILTAVGCASSDFSTATPSAETIGGTGNLGTGTAPMASANGGSSAGGDSAPNGAGSPGVSAGRAGSAGVGASITSPSPCGPLRIDEALFEVELCIESNTFTMGSSSPNLGTGHADHTPPHQVNLSAFVIDAFEVTVRRYRNCVAAGHCDPPSVDATRACTYVANPGPNDNLPISCVTAVQAEQFCWWDGKRRLPSEAEWERTARGNDDRPYPWGTGFACDRAVAASNGACASRHDSLLPGGSLPLGDSVEGAHDLAGNVAEWVKDYASSYPTGIVTDPTGPNTGVSRILRGGSLSSNAPDAQSFARVTTSGTTIGANGFRCANTALQ